MRDGMWGKAIGLAIVLFIFALWLGTNYPQFRIPILAWFAT